MPNPSADEYLAFVHIFENYALLIPFFASISTRAGMDTGNFLATVFAINHGVSTMDTLEHLAGYTQWANRVWLDHIAKTHSGDEYLTKMLAHIAQGERAWFQRLRGEKLDRNVWHPLTLPLVREQFDENSKLYREVLQKDRNRRIEYVRSGGASGAARVEDLLLYMCLRGDHHRAQMAVHLQRQNQTVPHTDYIEYSRSYGPVEIPRE